MDKAAKLAMLSDGDTNYVVLWEGEAYCIFYYCMLSLIHNTYLILYLLPFNLIHIYY